VCAFINHTASLQLLGELNLKWTPWSNHPGINKMLQLNLESDHADKSKLDTKNLQKAPKRCPSGLV